MKHNTTRMSEVNVQLNLAQKQAIEHTKGPLLIIAGAGTGKTTVITQKIAHIIKKQLAEPNEILALTFTDKAAEEMEDRVDKIVPYGTFDKWISTFHSFCQRILEAHALDIGLSTDFKLLNTTQSWLLIRKNFYAFNLEYYRPKGNPTKFIHALLKLFSRLKDENITPHEFVSYAENLSANADSTMEDEATTLEIQRIKEVADAYFKYQQLLLDNNCMDFADLIYYVNKLFAQRPNIRKIYTKYFKYVLIDEFQDTNYAQYELIKLLAPHNSNITVVGDDDQAIYKFRGASVSNILNFKKDYPDAKEIVLTNNYRSTQDILDVAYKFIQHNNPDRLEYQMNNPDEYYKKRAHVSQEKLSKKLISHTKSEGIIQLLPVQSQSCEEALVVEKIQELLKNHSPNDIAILVRANKTAHPFAEALEEASIPYLFLSNTGLYTTPIIIDLLSYARILDDREDAPALSRILQMPLYRVPVHEQLTINAFAKQKARTLFQTLEHVREIPCLSAETIQKIEDIVHTIKKHTEAAKKCAATEMILQVLNDTGYREYLINLDQTNPIEAFQEINAVNQFLKKIAQYAQLYDDKTLSGFVSHVNLEREAGDRGDYEKGEEFIGPEAVKILTVHASKGLEFSYVFLPELVEQRFPSSKRSDPITIPNELIQTREILPEGDEHLEEERRLFYVALTRAKKGVFLSYAKDYGGKRTKKPSPFLVESGILDKNEPPEMNHRKKSIPKITEKKQETQSAPLPIPKEFSYSQIAAFKKCPLQYKYQFVLKIPQDKGRHTFSFGRTMHNTMQGLFKLIQARRNASQGTLFGIEQKNSVQKSLVTIDELYRIYEKNWIDDWYESEQIKQTFYKSGKKILRIFYEKHAENWPHSLYLEKSFKLNLRGTTIKGRIDRIDKISDNSDTQGKKDANAVAIIDYKTTAFKKTVCKDDKMQLFIYQLAIEQQNLKPVALAYYYLNEEKQGQISFIGTKEDLERTIDELSKTIAEIKNSDFPANPSVFNCNFCDYKNICPFSAA